MEWENVVAGQRADPEQINKIGNQVAKYKGLRLARRIVLTEAVSSITFDTDDDGNPLDSEFGGELLFYSGENTSITNAIYLYLQINNLSGNVYVLGTSITTQFSIGYCAPSYTKNKVEIDVVNNNILIGSSFMYRTTSNGSYGNFSGVIMDSQSSVTTIKLFASTGTFPTGTVVEWWERG